MAKGKSTKTAKEQSAEAIQEKPISTPFDSVDDIKLGMVVRDPSTGLIGQADQKIELLSGTTQYTIQPQGDGKSVPDRYYVDDFLLEYVGPGVSDRVPAPDTADVFALGENLEDTITGYVGIALQRTTYLNGCVHYSLQRNFTKTKQKVLIEDIPQAVAFDYKRLKLVDSGVAAKEESGETVKTPKSKTGGPTLRAPGRMAPSRRA